MPPKNSDSGPLSPKKYIMTRARSLPVYKCLINPNWEEAGMASVLVARKHGNGNITGGFFLVDLLEKGVKDSYEFFNIPEFEFNEMLAKIFEEELQPVEIPYILAHNLVYSGIEFSSEQGYDGRKKAGLALYILEEDNDDIEFMEIPFGAERFVSMYGQDEEDEEEQDIMYFMDFSRDEWEEYFRENPDLNFEEHEDLTHALFFRLIQKENPDIYQEPYEFTDIPITYQMLQEHADNPKLTSLAEKLQMKVLTEKDPSRLRNSIMEIQEAIKTYPDKPILYNLLTQAYQLTGQEKEYKDSIEETYQKFPDYFYSKISKGHLLIEEGHLQEFEKLFPYPYSPMAAFPQRDVFHFTEIIPFQATVLRYFVHKGDLVNATRHSEMIYGTMIESPEIDAIPTSNIFDLAQAEFFEIKVAYCRKHWKKILE